MNSLLTRELPPASMRTMDTFRHHSVQFAKFAIVGLLSTALNYAVFYLLLTRAGLHYQICSAFGFIAGLVLAYPLNKLWTYRHRSKTTFSLGLRYVAVYLGSLILSLTILYGLVGRLHLDARLANVLAIGVTTCTNFAGTKFLVFRS